MTDNEKPDQQAVRTAALKAEREARLARALRDNLRRRKSPAPPPARPAPTDGGS
jgi:hypothetical protein